MFFKLDSTAFANEQSIPRRHTSDGEDISPPLAWSAPPPGTKSLVLICEDPDAPRGTWTHWVLFDVPPDAHQLAEAIPAHGALANGAKHGKNDFGNLGYGGPAPPRGKPHRYFFKLFALDQTLGLTAGAAKDEVIAACRGHVLGETQLMGKYQR